MINLMRKFLLGSIVTTVLVAYSTDLVAYEKKAPYEGYGKTSAVNGKLKTKPVKGHIKKTNKGYIRVNPYCRSR